MTAIAWAIVFIGLIFYDAIWAIELANKDLSKTVGAVTVFSLAMLIICTIRELSR